MTKLSTWRGFLLLLASVIFPGAAATAQTDQDAAKAFNALPLDLRFDIQTYLLAAGYSDAVANEKMSRQVYQSIKSFQIKNGLNPTGRLDAPQISRLRMEANPLLIEWGLQRFVHPLAGIQLWIPTSIVQKLKNEFEPKAHLFRGNNMVVIFEHFASIPINQALERSLQRVRKGNFDILYSIVKDDFFVMSSATSGNIERYERYHRLGSGYVGFILAWRTDVYPHGRRLAMVMSDLFRSAITLQLNRAPPATIMTGAIDRPIAKGSTAINNDNPQQPVDNAKRSSTSGSGFYVTKQGHIITNQHVVDECKMVTISGGGLYNQPARIIRMDAINDLALLQVQEKPMAVATLRTGAKIGEQAFAFGFPLSGILASSGNFTGGSITASAGIGDDTRMYQISTPVQPGNSGGPLLNQSGHVVGVVVAKLNAIKYAAAIKDIPQNINFAIKSSLVVSFLEANGIEAGDESSADVLAPSDIAGTATKYTVLVRCSK